MVPNMPKADYVIVDEIQDFTQEEIEAMAVLSAKYRNISNLLLTSNYYK